MPIHTAHLRYPFPCQITEPAVLANPVSACRRNAQSPEMPGAGSATTMGVVDSLAEWLGDKPAAEVAQMLIGLSQQQRAQLLEEYARDPANNPA